MRSWMWSSSLSAWEIIHCSGSIKQLYPKPFRLSSTSKPDVMIDFARVGLLIVVLMFSVQANERAKSLVREKCLRGQRALVKRGEGEVRKVMVGMPELPQDLDCDSN